MTAKPTDCATPVDVHVGKMLRSIRKQKGVSQIQLADALAISFQRVQKYENASNRISASKMFDAAKCLGVAPTAFFEGLDGSSAGPGLPQAMAGFFAHDGAAEIAEAFPKLSSGQRRSVVALVVSMAGEG